MYFLEVAAVRLGSPSPEVLLKRQLTWRNYLSAIKSTTWESHHAQTYYEMKTGCTEKLRFAGTVERQGDTLNVYFVFLPSKTNYEPYMSDEALWINTDALIQRVLRQPKKFSSHLLESMTKLLEHLSFKRKQAV
ncbi:MAG: hypothetical protein H2057_07610 [Alphaproteobacteria bacterium]|nr:hypothetical protein [Alphaproteobacteria bacterium]